MAHGGLAWVRGEWARLRSNKLIANASTYISGSFIQRAFEFLLLPLWARFLSPGDYGIIGAMTSYSSILFNVLLLGLAGAITRKYYDFLDDRHEQKRYVSSVALFQIGVAFAITFLLDRASPWIWQAMRIETIPFHPYVRLMLWWSYLRTLIQIPMTLYQTEQRAGRYLWVQYANFIANVGFSLLLVVLLRLGAAGQMWSNVIAALAVGLTFTVMMLRDWLVPGFSWAYVRSALVYGLPLVFQAVAGWAINQAGRVILQWNATLDELGLYTFGYNLGLVMNVLVMAVYQAWMPFYFRMMEHDSNPNQSMRRIVSIYIALLGGLCMVGILFASDIVYLLLPEKYYGSTPYVGPVLLGYFLSGLYYFAISPAYYYKKTRIIPLPTASIAVVNVILNLIVIPRYGGIGSAWATTATYALLMLVSLFIGQHYQRVPYPFARYALVLVLLLGAIFFAAMFTALTWFGLLAKITALLLFAALVGGMLLIPALRKPTAAA